MKFEYVGPNAVETVNGERVESPVNAYGGAKVKSGDRIELDGFLAKKALSNPNYREIKPRAKRKKVEAQVSEQEE